MNVSIYLSSQISNMTRRLRTSKPRQNISDKTGEGLVRRIRGHGRVSEYRASGLLSAIYRHNTLTAAPSVVHTSDQSRCRWVYDQLHPTHNCHSLTGPRGHKLRPVLENSRQALCNRYLHITKITRESGAYNVLKFHYRRTSTILFVYF